jgi:hypothetical protein
VRFSTKLQEIVIKNQSPLPQVQPILTVFVQPISLLGIKSTKFAKRVLQLNLTIVKSHQAALNVQKALHGVIVKSNVLKIAQEKLLLIHKHSFVKH